MLSVAEDREISKFRELYLEIAENEDIFLIELLFDLSISYRTLNAEDEKDDIAFGLKQINEINHRILNRLRYLRSEKPWSSREDTIEMVEHHIHSAPFIAGWVGIAIDKAYSRVYTQQIN